MGWAGNLSSRFLVVTDFCLQPLDLTTWKLADIPHLPSSESSPSLTYSVPQWEQREPRVDLLLLHCLLWVSSTGTLSQLLPSCLCFVWKIIKASSPSHTFPIAKPSRLSLISWPSSPHTYAHRLKWHLLRHLLCGIFENVKPDPEPWTTAVCAVFGCQPVPYAYTYTASLSQTLQCSPCR